MAEYKPITKIGEGGFGEVWTCKADGKGALLAMKSVLPTLDEDGKERFAREVRILGSLDHPNIVRVLDTRLNFDPLFYIMPLYQRSLSVELANLGGDKDRINAVMTRILDAVEYAHKQGVLHRDLNLRNVLMNSDDDLVISDFGLGRLVDSESSRKTMSGYGMGTVFYMPPEQVDNAKYADQRADVYSLGRMVYELFTGPLNSLHQDVSGLPPVIAHIVTRCTQHNPDHRFQTVTELKNARRTNFDAVAKLVGLDELRALVSILVTSGRFESNQVRQLSDLLEQNQEDKDLIHEVLMKLDARLISEAWRYNKGGIGLILHEFLLLIAQRGWGFDYTDTIADHLQRLYAVIDDPALRATIITSLFELGESHNRWHVLGVFDQFMYQQRSKAELAQLVAALGQMAYHRRHAAAERLNPQKLPAEVRQVLQG